MGVEKWGQNVGSDKDMLPKLADHLYAQGLIKLSQELICFSLLYIFFFLISPKGKIVKYFFFSP